MFNRFEQNIDDPFFLMKTATVVDLTWIILVAVGPAFVEDELVDMEGKCDVVLSSLVLDWPEIDFKLDKRECNFCMMLEQLPLLIGLVKDEWFKWEQNLKILKLKFAVKRDELWWWEIDAHYGSLLLMYHHLVDSQWIQRIDNNETFHSLNLRMQHP